MARLEDLTKGALVRPIGSGMAVFSRYARVVEADGSRMRGPADRALLIVRLAAETSGAVEQPGML